MFLNSPLQAWLSAVSIAAIVLLALVSLRTLVIRQLGPVAARTETRADDIVVELARRTRTAFMLLLALAAGALVLTIDALTRSRFQVVLTLALLAQVAMWLDAVVSLWIESYADRKAEEDAASRTTLSALTYAVRFAVWVAVALVALDTLNVRVTALITGLGVTGIAVALAVQNILGDLFGALSIVLDKPFVIGDSIAVDTISGTVEHIGLKTTRIRSATGEQVVFSNSDLLKSRIRNFRRLSERRNTIVTVLAPHTPGEKLAELPTLIADVVSAVSGVRLERSHLRGVTDAGYEIETVYWVVSAEYAAHMNAQQTIHLAIVNTLRREGVTRSFRAPPPAGENV